MLHNVLVAVHATCAVVAFVFGLVAVWQPGSRVSILFRSYVGALWLMVLFLVIVVLVDWAGLDPVTRVVYSGLLTLAVYPGGADGKLAPIWLVLAIGVLGVVAGRLGATRRLSPTTASP